MSDERIDEIDHLRVTSEALRKRESTTKTWITLVTGVGLGVIFMGMSLFTFYAYEQRRVALQRSLEAEVQRDIAERERDIALSLTLRIERSGPVLATSPDHRRSISRAGWLLDNDGKPLAQIAAAGLDTAVFSPNGRFAFIEGSGTGPVLIDADSGKTFVSLTEVGRIFSIAFSPNSKILVIASEKGVFRGELSEGNIGPIETGTARQITFAAFSPISSTLVLGTQDGGLLVSHDGGLRIYLLDTGALQFNDRDISATAFSRDDRSILILYRDGQGVNIDLMSGKVISSFIGLAQYFIN